MDDFPMNSPKRLDNYFESNQEQILSANYVHLKQYLNQRKSTRKMLNYFFHREMSFLQIRPRIQSKTGVIDNLREYEKA